MTSNTYTHTEVANSVRSAFSTWGKAARVVSGLLKAAVKRGEIESKTVSGRVTGALVWYVMTDNQLAAIRAEAIKRGDESLRAKMCQPMTIEQAAEVMAGDWLPRRFQKPYRSA
jgi:hypothetical protein